MYKKPHSFTFLALFVFLFSQVCFADVPQTIQTTQSKILSLIDAGDFNGAQAAIEQMKANFAGNTELPKQLCRSAYKYEQVESLKQAKSLNAQIVTNFPGQDAAKFAGLQLAKLNIYDSIDRGDYDSVDSAISRMVTDFKGNENLPRRLWEVANRFDKAKAFKYAKTLSSRIAADYPNDTYAKYASLLGAKLKIYEKIDAGDYNSANSAVTAMTRDFAGHKQLPRRLYEIAHQYEKKGVQAYANRLHSQIAEGWPNDEYGIRAAFQHKMEIYTTLDDSKIAEMQTAINKLIADSNSQPQLAQRLPKIMLDIAEMSYDKVADSDAQQQSVNKLLHFSSELLAKYAVGKTTGSTAYYMLGLNYDKLGEYAKAADAFKNAYQVDSKFKYADYCLFAQGHCYEKLMNNKLISETEAKPRITSNYNKLLAGYPQSKYLLYAIQWLQNNQ